MNSMQEALTSALEHPIPVEVKPRQRQNRTNAGQSMNWLWAAVGSMVSFLTVALLYKRYR